MDRFTYVALKNADLYNIVDRDRLEEQRHDAVPIVREKIDMFLRPDRSPVRVDPSWGMVMERFRERFASASNPRDRMDEVAVTFLLFLAYQVAEVKIARTFVHHGAWGGEWSWQLLFKWVVYSVFSLLYGVRSWKAEYFASLDELCLELVVFGETDSLRRFAEKLGVGIESSKPYPAETHFAKMGYHSNLVFGPYVWRTMHWMAEAFAARTDEGDDDDDEEEEQEGEGKRWREPTASAVGGWSFAKKLWKEFVTDAMYRTLQCGMCMFHYRSLLEKEGWKEKILRTPNSRFPEVWYDLHNRINRNSGLSSDYPRERWEEDRRFMRAALERTKKTPETTFHRRK